MERSEKNSYYARLTNIKNNFLTEDLTLPLEVKLRELKQLLEDQFEPARTKFGAKSRASVPLWKIQGLKEDPDAKLTEVEIFLKSFNWLVSDLGHLSHSYDVEHDLENNPKIIALIDEISQGLPARPAPESAPKEMQSLLDLNSLRAKIGVPVPAHELVEKYQTFAKSFGVEVKNIYYPGSGTDVSPSFAFPEAKTTYLDLNVDQMANLKRNGYEAYADDALKFNPGPMDLLIIMNAGIPPELIDSCLGKGGFLLCNDWHGTASKLNSNQNYELLGIVRNNGNGDFFDQDHPEQYWQEIETDDEFKNAPFSFSSPSFRYAENIVQIETGKTENVLDNYKKIIAEAREAVRLEFEEVKLKGDGSEEFVLDPESDLLPVKKGNVDYVLNANLPRKKGVVDDVFVFRKVR